MLLVKNARHLDAHVDLYVKDGKILTLVPTDHWDGPTPDEVFDAHGTILMPALVDCHTHLREPGFEYKEDIETGLNAAAHGGFGSIMCMANTKPANDTAAVTTLMLERARATHPHGPRLFPVAAATCNLKGEEMAPLAELRKAGCIAVSNDGIPMANTELVRRIMEYAADLGMIFIDHCEDPWLAKGWRMDEGPLSGKLGLKGQPGAGEAIQAARDILLAQYLDIPVHIAHVSSRQTVEIIKWGKEQGIKVTAETCPHYLLLDSSAVDGYNPLAKVSPPLRSPEDQLALLEAVKSGIIDILVTDHAPHAAHEKNDTFDAVPCGMIGLDLALPLSFILVNQGILAEADLHRLWATRPAQIFGLETNEFLPGDPANFLLYNPATEWQVAPENLFSKSANTPFLNTILKGRVAHLWLQGQKMVWDETVDGIELKRYES